MLAQIKSEFRKLFTVRSTYILVIVALLLTILFSYFGTSAQTYDEAVCDSTGEVIYSSDFSDEQLSKASPEDICGGSVSYTTKTERNLPKEKLLFTLQETLPLTITFVSIVLVLLVAHEFRYNTISYTLTISNSRSKVLLAKIIAGTVFTLATTLLALGVTLATFYLAVNIKNLYLPTQDYNWVYILSRHFVYALGTTLIFMGIAILVRNLVASIAAVFVLPIIDSIAGLLLMTRDIEPTKVLPFSSLDRFGNVVSDMVPGASAERFGGMDVNSQATVVGSLVAFGLYFIVVWSLAWLTFLRRDAN
jgi:ABC-type transport system involved in multi-copper enzyme maturation permease subunit